MVPRAFCVMDNLHKDPFMSRYGIDTTVSGTTKPAVYIFHSTPVPSRFLVICVSNPGLGTHANFKH
jgi:hypothetical protein